MSRTETNYTIRSALARRYVGHHPLTKDQKIVALPRDSEPALWKIESAMYANHYMKTDGLPTGVVGDGVYTILHGPAERWYAKPLPLYGRDQYLIYTENGTLGWVLPDYEDYTPVIVQPIVSTISFLQPYPPNQRWIVEKQIIEKSIQDLD